MKKLLTAFIALLIGLIALSSVAIAQPAPDFVFQDVEVDGVDVLGTDSTVFVERGDRIDVRVEFMSNIDSDRVRVKAWIGGFEFGDVEDKTSIFTVEPDVIYPKTLTLEVPEDIELDEDEFRLHIEIFDNDGNEREETFRLGVRKERHSLSVLDTLFFPGNTVEAGRPLRVNVRVENLGERKEEDILVKVSIPELGLSTRDFIDELVPEENDDGREETSESSGDLVLFIPNDAKPGEYLVEVDVEFNRGHDVVSEKRTILVEGPESAIISGEANTIVSIDTTSNNVAQASEIPYKFMLANLGNKRTVYSVAVNGVSGWGSARVSPSLVSIDQGQAAEMFVFVKANENAPLGNQIFQAKVLANGVEFREVGLTANIVEAGEVSSFGNLQRGLEVGFIILVIILVILGLAIAFRKIGQRSDEPRSETETIEGQTYY